MKRNGIQLAAWFVVICLSISLLFPTRSEGHSGTFVFTDVSTDAQSVHVALRIDLLTAFEIPGTIDANGDKRIDDKELADALIPVVFPYINSHLTITNNGNKLPMRLNEGSMPNPSIMRLELTFPAEEQIGLVSLNDNLFFDQAPGHSNIGTLRMADGNTREFVLSAGEHIWSYDFGAASSGTFTTIRQFILLGIEHILTGYDHLLFLLALLLAGANFRSVVLMVSSFTVAHSTTLILAATGVVSLPGKWVESAIALTIIYVAVENIGGSRLIRYRWLLTFAFGLIHGFGFAGALKEIGLPKHQEILALLTFNAGVEIGQLAIVACLLPLLTHIKQRAWFPTTQRFASLFVGIMGLYWFVSRIGFEFFNL